jgi:hypothetical protein
MLLMFNYICQGNWQYISNYDILMIIFLYFNTIKCKIDNHMSLNECGVNTL